MAYDGLYRGQGIMNETLADVIIFALMVLAGGAVFWLMVAF